MKLLTGWAHCDGEEKRTRMMNEMRNNRRTNTDEAGLTRRKLPFKWRDDNYREKRG